MRYYFKKALGIIFFILIFTTCFITSKVNALDQPTVVTFYDINLERAVREALGKQNDYKVTSEDMLQITELHIADRDIGDLRGIEHAVNLRILDLNSNRINSLVPLALLNNIELLNLGKNEIQDLFPLEGLTGLRDLNLSSNRISDISPLKGLTNLCKLNLGSNQIEDITSVKELTLLEVLILQKNMIKDISTVAELTSLQRIDLFDNNINSIIAIFNNIKNGGFSSSSDIDVRWNDIDFKEGSEDYEMVTELVGGGFNISYKPQKGDSIEIKTITFRDHNLEAAVRAAVNKPTEEITTLDMILLKSLHANNKTIVDLSGVEYAIYIENLDLSSNDISDITCLSDLTNLKTLSLEKNKISEIISLLTNYENGGFRMGGYINLSYNYLDDNQMEHVEYLKAHSVDVLFMPQGIIGPPSISSVSPAMDSINVPLNSPITIVFNEHVEVGSGFNGISLKNSIGQSAAVQANLSDNKLTVTPLQNLNFNIKYTLIIPAAAVKDTDGNPMAGDYTLTFTTAMPNPTTVVSFNDQKLDAAVRKALLKPAGDITAGDMARLIRFDANQFEISDLTGIEFAVNLEHLNIQENYISNLMPIANLTNLLTLSLYKNRIADITPIAGLTKLLEIDLGSNQISNIGSLSGLKRLLILNLGGNRISNISSLSGITDLHTLSLDSNQIDDISILGSLPFLRTLNLENNFVSDISSISYLGSLQSINLRFNKIRNISPLVTLSQSGLPMLDSNVDLEWNYLDLSPGSQTYNNIRTLLAKPITVTYENQKYMDGNPPSLLSTTPDNTSVGVLKHTSINLQFNDYLQQGQNFSSISLKTPNGNVIPVTVNISGHFVNIIPDNSLNLGTTYTVTVPADSIKDIDGNVLSADFSFSFTTIPWDPSTVVTINDDTLLFVLRNTLGIPDIVPITAGDMNRLTALYDNYTGGVTNLTGLEYALNLRTLWMRGNLIDSVVPISGLKNLEDLRLDGNRIADISGLSGLTNLKYLSLSSNRIVDLKPLSGLTKLEKLNLNYNQITDTSALRSIPNIQSLDLSTNLISDISPVSEMTSVTELYLNYNLITDISTLSKLTGLFKLDLGHNEIFNITPLAGLTKLRDLSLTFNVLSDITPIQGLIRLVNLDLSYNQLRSISPLVTNNQNGVLPGLSSLNLSNNYLNLQLGSQAYNDIQTLKNYGVNVIYSTQKPHDVDTPVIIETNPAKGSMGVPINTCISVNFNENILEGQYFYNINLKSNSVNNISVTLDINGSNLLITPSGSLSPETTYTVTVPIGSINDTGGNCIAKDYIFSFTTGVFNLALPVTIPDPNLEDAIRLRLNKPTGQITTGDMAGLTYLYASNYDIRDLTGLEHAINIQTLNLDRNKISNLVPITGMTKLNEIRLDQNQISSISSLRGLYRLQKLSLNDNQISDIEPLSGLTSLKDLDIASNQVSDISVIGSRLTKLQYLSLSGNKISDITPLAGMTGLLYLSFNFNPIGDFSPISSLINLQSLGISSNQLSDISFLRGLVNLKSLVLVDNLIRNIGPLAGLTKLETLYIAVNEISDISHLSGLSNLRDLDIGSNRISDLTSLTGLTKLYNVQLENNRLTSIAPLVTNNQNGGLTSGSKVTLFSNYLDVTEGSQVYNDIKTLERRGVTIDYRFQRPIDTTSPTVSSTVPGDKSTRFPVKGTIRVDFDDFIQRGDNLSNITLTDSGGNNVPITCKVDYNIQSTLNIVPAISLNTSTTYTVVIPAGAVNDLAGNPLISGYTFSFTTTPYDLATVVNFNDAGLEAAIREELQKTEGPITAGDMAALTWLDAYDRGISDLTGLEYAVYLKNLIMNNNQISNISKISGLADLERLDLRGNRISNISPLSGLIKLQKVDLSSNRIMDISPLIICSENRTVPNDSFISLQFNWLDLTAGSKAYNDIQTLESRGFDVYYFSQDPDAAYPPKVIGTTPENNSKWALANTQISVSFNKNIIPGPNIGGITLKDSNQNIIPVTAGVSGQKLNIIQGSSLSYGKVYTVRIPSGAVNDEFENQLAADYTFSFATALYDPLTVVVFSDSNLEAAVRQSLNKSDGQITAGDMDRLYGLEARNRGISNLNGLEYAVNLRYLYLSTNNISSLEPIAGLKDLYSVELLYNMLTDISPLVANSINGGLSSGDYVDISYNYIDITEGSKAYGDIETLISRGVSITYLEQRKLDNTPPSVAVTEPADRSTGIKVNITPILVRFTEKVRVGTNTIGITLKDITGNTVPVTTSINDNVISITLQNNLNHGTTYTVTIPQNFIRDMAGNTMVNDYKFSFTTELELLTVIGANPPDKVNKVPINKKVINVLFNKDISKGEKYADIVLKGSDGKTVNLTTEIDKNVLIIKPGYDLKHNTDYTITVPKGAVYGVQGNVLLQDYTSTFRTAPEKTSLSITKSNPGNNAVNVPVDTVITIEFNKNISAVLDVDGGTNKRKRGKEIVLKDGLGKESALSCSIAGNKLIIKPLSALENGTTHELVIPQNAVWDMDKNNLGQNYIMTFTTVNSTTIDSAPTLKEADPTITAIENISNEIVQGEKYTLPASVKASMSDGSTKEVTIKWNTEVLDTSKEGKFVFEGKVEGFDRNIVLTLIIAKKAEDLIIKPEVPKEQSLNKVKNKEIKDQTEH